MPVILHQSVQVSVCLSCSLVYLRSFQSRRICLKNCACVLGEPVRDIVDTRAILMPTGSSAVNDDINISDRYVLPRLGGGGDRDN